MTILVERACFKDGGHWLHFHTEVTYLGLVQTSVILHVCSVANPGDKKCLLKGARTRTNGYTT